MDRDFENVFLSGLKPLPSCSDYFEVTGGGYGQDFHPSNEETGGGETLDVSLSLGTQ